MAPDASALTVNASEDKPLRVFGYANSPRVLSVMVGTCLLYIIFVADFLLCRSQLLILVKSSN
jgi:hypothetical protein